MPRIRTIKPEFWVDEKVVELDPWARLLFIGIWNFADDQGYIEHSPKRIKMQIFPGDSVDVPALLADLLGAGLLSVFGSPSGEVLRVANWERHQRVSNPSAGRFHGGELVPLESSRVLASPQPASAPPVPREVYGDVQSRTESSVLTDQGLDLGLESPREDSRVVQSPLLGREGKGKGKELQPSAAADAASALTPTQRSKVITDAYHSVQPMCRWPAVNGVVLTAIKTGRYADDEIQQALLSLAEQGRGVTVETLRVQLEGMAPPSNVLALRTNRPSTTDQRVGAALALAAKFAEEDR